MNEKKLAANRMNALKSTGPKSPSGKAASSKNAVKHGLLAQTPIISGVESRKMWERHRDSVLQSIGPVDYIHNLLAIQLAVVSWNLWRVDRYETEVTGATVATAELDLGERIESGKPPDPATARTKAEQASLILELLNNLADMSDVERVETNLAVATLWALWQEIPDNRNNEDIRVPGIPDDDIEFNAFELWTAGLLRKATEVYAAAAGMTPKALLNKCISSVCTKRLEAEAEERYLVERGKRWELLLAHSRMLLQADAMDKLSRYKSNLERSFFRILHELQRYQASRCGAIIPPPAAMDVDLTVHSESSN